MNGFASATRTREKLAARSLSESAANIWSRIGSDAELTSCVVEIESPGVFDKEVTEPSQSCEVTLDT